ncbi:methanogen output domain 1-containing protein [Roseibium sediminicola]|uniref:Methanogen output domain 1-containing protein n=1 Tax=Roseibium sediminicola TaxID=2933272 RepID=A0ABT0GSW1_9HYPH|nr:methanogen output domain 1-containing protein [Roseibium sp. CAU 1639]MCK7612162.1 methanogen output domain 1-containing protein [Roseibium sp. CAU 1639]
MSVPAEIERNLTELDKTTIPLEKTDFFNQVINELSGALQEIVGLNEAEGFITLVASRIGEKINQDYKSALNLDHIPRDLLPNVLVDLKRRIEGRFSIEYEDDKVIVLRNTRCPFGDRVMGRPALCMMTTNVFGRIAADSTGYARVDIEKAIAKGDSECRVTVHLAPAPEHDEGSKEFFKVR